MNIEQLHTLFLECSQVTTDTRKIESNSLFFALKGDNFNGNEFANEALKKGASYAVIDEVAYQTSERHILVENTLETLQTLASFHRHYLAIPIISLTGSNGKTTTKELINAVLSKKFDTTATVGNLNNHIGVPLTLLSMSSKTEIGIVEMGANHLKEIALLSSIAQPDYGYITNFGKAHLEGFGSLEGVVQGKTELYANLKGHGKMVFVNTNDAQQVEQSKGMKCITFGRKGSKYPIEFITADPFVILRYETKRIKSQLIGAYNFNNIAAAIAIGKHFEVSDQAIQEAIETYVPTNNRSQILDKGTNKVILDAYNANPSSMKVALENFSGLTDKTKIAILGDMFELGHEAEAEHQFIADLASNLDIHKVYLLGENFQKVSAINDSTQQFASFEAFKDYFSKQQTKNTTLLIKASRGMALERIVELL